MLTIYNNRAHNWLLEAYWQLYWSKCPGLGLVDFCIALFVYFCPALDLWIDKHWEVVRKEVAGILRQLTTAQTIL